MALLDPLVPVITCIPLPPLLEGPITLGMPAAAAAAAAAALDAENPERLGFLVALTRDKPCSCLAWACCVEANCSCIWSC